MKKNTKLVLCLLSILSFLLIVAAPGFCASNAELEKRIQVLEEKSQNGSGSDKNIWLDMVTFSGAIEVETVFEDSSTDGDSSDISLATAELGIEVTPEDWLTGFMLIEWDSDEDKMNIDEAHITIGGTEDFPYYLTAGRLYVPFGAFETMMISDPITCDLAEIRDDAVLAGVEINGISFAAYVFNGQTDEDGEDDTIKNFGASAGYALETETFSLDMGIDWINSILESDTLNADAVGANPLKDYVPGIAVHAMANIGPVCLIGEYVEATDDIEFTDATPTLEGMSAWAVEAGYTFEISGFEITVAAGFQSSDDAAGILPEDKIIGVVSTAITDNLGIAVEYASAQDYSVSDGGAGNDVDTLTLQLAFEF